MPTKNTSDNKSQVDDTLDIVNQLLYPSEFTPPIDSVPKHGDIKPAFHFNYKDKVALIEERNKPFYRKAFEKARRNRSRIASLWFEIGDKLNLACSDKRLGEKYNGLKRDYRNARDAAKTSGDGKTTWMYFNIFQQIPGVNTEDEPLTKVSIGGEDPTIILNDGKAVKKEVKKEKKIKRVERETDEYKEKNRIYGVFNKG